MGNDLYWDVLQIPKEKRPPTHYDLLGLPFGEDDPALIDAAVQKQIRRIKLCQAGPYADQCPRLVKELASAKATLTDPKKRADYLAILPNVGPGKPAARTGTAKPSTMPKKVADPAAVKKPVAKDDGVAFAVGLQPPVRTPKKNGIGMLLFAAAAMVVLLAIGVWIVIAVIQNSARSKDSGSPAVASATATVTPPLPPTHPTILPPDPAASLHADSDPRENLPVLDDPLVVAEKPIESRSFKRHTMMVSSIAISPTGRRFLTGSVDKTFLDWKIDDGKSFRRQVFKSGVAAVAYSPNGQQAALCDEGTVCLFDLTQNTILATRLYPRGNAQCLAFHPDGIHVVVGGTDGTLHWWNLNDEKPEKSIDIGANENVLAVALSPDGTRVVAGMSNGSLGVWEIPDGRKVWHGIAHKDKLGGGVTAVAFSPDGKHVASAGLDRTAAYWSSEAVGPSLKRFPHESSVLSVGFLAGGSQLATGAKDATVRIWELETGITLRTLKADAAVQCLAIHRENKFLIAGGPNGNLQLISLKDALSDPSLRETPPEMKYPVPDSAAVEAATLAVRNSFRALLDSEKPEDREVLLDKLQLRAAGKETQSMRYALFCEAHDVAAKLGKISAAYKVIEEMDKWFKINVLAEKASVLTLAAAEAPAATQKGVIDATNSLLAAAEKENRPEVAKAVLQAMTQAAAKSDNPALVNQVNDFQKKRAADTDLRERIAKLRAKLKEMPNDPDANLGYGLIQCSQENWDEGLAMLAKGSDKPLASLAKRDRAGAKELKDRREIGDEWWSLSKNAEESRMIYLTRAKFWYEQIRTDLMGQDKLDLASRINQIDETLNKAKKPDPGTVAAVTKPAPKRDEILVRAKFNTALNEATFKTEWKSDGEWRVESSGIRLASGKGEITSAFQLIDNWKIEIIVVPEAREVQIEVNQETFTVDKLTANSTPALIIVERKGKKLGYTAEQAGRIKSGTVIDLKADRLGPSTIVIRTEKGNGTAKSDGTLFGRILLTGRVKMVSE